MIKLLTNVFAMKEKRETHGMLRSFDVIGISFSKQQSCSENDVPITSKGTPFVSLSFEAKALF